MSSRYELWLTDDKGVRLLFLNEITYLTYTRAVNQFGSVEFGYPFEPFKAHLNPWFHPDWRLEVWRSPEQGRALRREGVFLLRKPLTYVRAEDNMHMIRFYGRNGWDLLHRRVVAQRGGTQWAAKTDFADDMMKDIVREQMLYGSALDENGAVDNGRAWPQSEFIVQGNVSLGPTVTHSFEGRNVLDVLKEIKEITFQKNLDNSSSPRVYFDVIPQQIYNAPSGSAVGWQFVTHTGLFGVDRTSGIEYSLENENIRAPSYSISHLDEINAAFVQGGGRAETQIIQEVTDAARIAASRWNRCEAVVAASNESDTTGLTDRGQAELGNNRPREDIPLQFVNTPGSNHNPRSLYGVDWDLGDRLRVSFAGKQFEVDVNLVYVSVNDQGREDITGRNEVNSAG